VPNDHEFLAEEKSKICIALTFPLTHHNAALTPTPCELGEKRGESRDTHQRVTLTLFLTLPVVQFTPS
jgi:hypothetical protein